MKVKVKICGITNLADAEAAIKAGADYLGFIFYPKSPRGISVEQAGYICGKLSAPVKKVGVFVNADEKAIKHAVKLCKLDVIQLHGEESPETARALGQDMVWKAFSINNQNDIDKAAAYPADAILADTKVDGLRGGTGKTCDWRLAAITAATVKTVLAGGITPDNAVEAAVQVKPYALDIASGVETRPGIKDHKKIALLINNLRNNNLKD